MSTGFLKKKSMVTNSAPLSCENNMQITHYPNPEDYPRDVKCQSVNVWMHDSMMLCTHDYSCPVCRKESAVLDLSCGIMQPCHLCQKNGYKLVKRKPNFISKLFGSK